MLEEQLEFLNLKAHNEDPESCVSTAKNTQLILYEHLNDLFLDVLYMGNSLHMSFENESMH